MANGEPILGVIGGSGLYEMSGLENIEVHRVNTPFGEPSSPVVVGELSGRKIAFLARHGAGHRLMPTEVNYRANIYAMKSLGVSRLVSISACGSLREDYKPGDIVIPDQLVDFTRNRKRTFFGDGIVAHISIADPFCPHLSRQLLAASQQTGSKVHKGGGFITIEGPRFSTRAESNLFRSWGLSLIGMTTSPEAYLAREAEICYAVMAHVTDYDVWHISEQPVTVEMVIEILNQNTQAAQEAVRLLVSQLSDERDCECGQALSKALITSPDVIPDETYDKLRLLVGKYIKK